MDSPVLLFFHPDSPRFSRFSSILSILLDSLDSPLIPTFLSIPSIVTILERLVSPARAHVLLLEVSAHPQERHTPVVAVLAHRQVLAEPLAEVRRRQMGRVKDKTRVAVDSRQNDGNKHQIHAVVREFSELASAQELLPALPFGHCRFFFPIYVQTWLLGFGESARMEILLYCTGNGNLHDNR